MPQSSGAGCCGITNMMMVEVEEQKSGVKASVPLSSETMLVAINGGSPTVITEDELQNEEQEVATKFIDAVKQPPPMSSEDSGRYLDQIDSASLSVNTERSRNSSTMSNGGKQNAVWPSMNNEIEGEKTHNDDEIIMEAIAKRMYKPKPQSTSPQQRSESPILDDEPPPPKYQETFQPSTLEQQQRRQSRGRRRTTVSGYGQSSLHKSSSMPSLATLEISSNNNNDGDDDDKYSPTLTHNNNTNNNTPNFNESVTRGRIYPWQHKDFGRPLMSERRSLSPKVSSFHRHGFGRPPPSRLARENDDTLFYMSLVPGMMSPDSTSRTYPYDIPGTGLDTSDRHEHHTVGTNHLNSYYSQSKHHGSRRASLPEHLEQALRNGSSPSEVMDPNAMRYLPKILRDTYAQRQTKRRSTVSMYNIVLEGVSSLQCGGMYMTYHVHKISTKKTNPNVHIFSFPSSLSHTTTPAWGGTISIDRFTFTSPTS